MKAHVIDSDGTVINTILVSDLNFIPNLIDARLGGKIGDRWTGVEFVIVQPATPVPQVITKRQGKIILSRYNLLDTVLAALAAMEGQEGVEARIDFEDATEWRRDWPILLSLSQSLGLSTSQIDQMFIEGALV